MDRERFDIELLDDTDPFVVAQVPEGVMVVPLAPGSTPDKARPCGLYPAPSPLERRYLRDR